MEANSHRHTCIYIIVTSASLGNRLGGLHVNSDWKVKCLTDSKRLSDIVNTVWGGRLYNIICYSGEKETTGKSTDLGLPIFICDTVISEL